MRVEFRSGRSVTVTPHHPFLLADGWRPAEEIAVGEEAALPARLPFPAEPRRLPAAELSALVARLSDHGCGRSRPDRPLPDAAYRLSPDQLARLPLPAVDRRRHRGARRHPPWRWPAAPAWASSSTCSCGSGSRAP